MRSIFISYRRGDAEGQAGRLFDDLAAHFGKNSVFMDVEDIEPGRDFRQVIDQHVSSCGVLLAMVGKGWLGATDEVGRRRLDDPNDFVRLETASALRRDIPVIPVLVQGATMPKADSLPDDLKEFAFRNAVELTHPRWESDVQVLIKALSRHVDAGKQHVQSEITKRESDASENASGKGAFSSSDESGARSSGKNKPTRMPQLLILIVAMIAIAFATIMYYNTKKAAEEQKAAAQKVAMERAAAEKAAEEQRAAAAKAADERAKAERAIEEEKKAAAMAKAERSEAKRAAREQRAAAERAAAEKAVAERRAAGKAATKRASAGKEYDKLCKQGVAAQTKGELDEAIHCYNKAISLKSDSFALFFMRGLAYRQKNQFANAVSDFSRAIALNPRYALAYNNRGISYVGIRENRMAMIDFKKACELGLNDGCTNVRKLNVMKIR